MFHISPSPSTPVVQVHLRCSQAIAGLIRGVVSAIRRHFPSRTPKA